MSNLILFERDEVGKTVRRLTFISCVLLLMAPEIGFAEYPHFLNVMPASRTSTPIAIQKQINMAAARPSEPRIIRRKTAKPQSPTPAPQFANTSSTPDYRESSGAWVTQCWSAPTKRCEILQQYIHKPSGKQIMLIGFSISQRSIPQLTMVISKETITRENLTIVADRRVLVEAPLKGCTISDCVYLLDITADKIKQLSDSQEAEATIQFTENQLTKIALNNTGLIDGLTKANQFLS